MSRGAAPTPALLDARWMTNLRVVVPFVIVGLIGLMILPLPALVLDLLISLNISLSMVVLLTAVSIRSPLHFSVLPSVLLLTTVLRLGLNIASTRRILLHGSEGTSAAGAVIEAFGNFVVGGNMIVGLVVFLVLLAVQFIVINHGANRISEVAARFTLDAMPGKQMAIDADLNAGLIDEREARRRRDAIQEEADFYGSMDGAVKFTQRDAIASLIIVSINIIAGLAIGILQAGMNPLEAVATYTTLTVGDGLVTAIPALLVSVAGALITTRSGTDDELSSDLAGQMLSDPRPLGTAAGVLGLLALVPGLPTIPFLTLAAGIGAAAWSLRGKRARAESDVARSEKAVAEAAPEEPIEPLLQVDPLTIEVGYDLVQLAGSEEPGGLLDRIRKIRRQLALDLGIVVPPVRVRDNLNLAPDQYRILLRGVESARARLPRNRCLAIDPGDVLEPIQGEATKDPAFGIDALWIDERKADHARGVGYTIVDRTSVLATHLSELIREHAPDLLGRQETQKLLDMLAKQAPKLVEELVPESYTVGQVQKVLQGLLAERVSIRDLEAIGEALADVGGRELPVEAQIAHVRRAIGRAILQPYLQGDTLHVVTLAPEVEDAVRGLLRPAGGGPAVPADPRQVQQLAHKVAVGVRNSAGGAQQAVLCNDPDVRAFLRRATDRALPTVPFLAVHEIPDGIPVNAVGQVK